MQIVLLLFFCYDVDVIRKKKCDSNVMLFTNKYIHKSLSSGWGEKTKLSREFLSNIFSMKTIERTIFTSYCLWLFAHDLSHISFLIVCSYATKFSLFSNYPMSLNVLRHMMKFCNSAVLRLRILPILRLKYFCKNIHSCVRFAKAEKKKKQPRRERLN